MYSNVNKIAASCTSMKNTLTFMASKSTVNTQLFLYFVKTSNCGELYQLQ